MGPKENYMEARTFFPASTALAILLVGCTAATPPTPPPDTRDADAKALRQLEADWDQVLGTKDVDKITSYYAEDASILYPSLPVVTGKANIASVYKPVLADKNSTLSFVTDKVVVSKSGDMAYTQGSNAETFTDPKTKKVFSQKGKYVAVYIKQADGSWKDVIDIDNLDGPPVLMKK
jgi:ketosteroid isomerase-like protein